MGDGHLKHIIKNKPGIIFPGIFFLAFLISHCAKKEETRELRPESAVTITEIDSAASQQLLAELLDLQTQIREHPSDVELRKLYLAKSIDSQTGAIRTAGIGLPPQNSPSALISQQAAERAALMDAGRWIAYILEWRQHIDSPDFGSISGDIPGTKIIYKNLTPDTVEVLVQAQTS